MLYHLEGSEKEREKIIADKSDDPYFYDAYQGVKDLELSERKQIARDIKVKLDNKVKANRKIGLPLLKAAAGLAILTAMCLWVFNFNEAKKQVVFAPNKQNEQMTDLREKIKSDEPIIQEEVIVDNQIQEVEAASAEAVIPNTPQPPADNTFTSDEQVFIEQNNTPITYEAPVADQISKFEEPGTGIRYESVTSSTSNPNIGSNQAQSNITTNTIQNQKTSNSSPSARPPKVVEKSKRAPIEINETSAEREQIIAKLDQDELEEAEHAPLVKKLNGIVTDDNGEPLFGVTVIAEKSMNGTSTDFNGAFDLEGLIDGEPIVFSYGDFEVVTQNFRSNKPMNVTLKNNPSLSETIVSSSVVQESAPTVIKSDNIADGFGARQSNENLKFAKPASGWKTFKNQIEKNRRYPSEAIENNIEGRVIISFFVDENGQLSDFQVKKSLGYGCDEEAIRLLKNGPPWDAGATNTRAEYTFRFK